jgi:hypothetical protein
MIFAWKLLLRDIRGKPLASLLKSTPYTFYVANKLTLAICQFIIGLTAIEEKSRR